MIKAKRFSIITMNLRFGLADQGENAWKNRKYFFPKLLDRYPFDFLGTQESNHFQTRFLHQILENCHYIGQYNLSKKGWQNNIIFYKKQWRCLDHQHYFLSQTPERESKFLDSDWPRQCTIGVFAYQSCKLIHVNTHFDFKETVQKKSADLILKLLSAYPENLPIIITGDFNAHPGKGAYQAFKENGFSEVFDRNHTFTFHEFTGQGKHNHIDWILYRGPLKLIDKKIIRDSFEGKFPSDHFPVAARFEID